MEQTEHMSWEASLTDGKLNRIFCLELFEFNSSCKCVPWMKKAWEEGEQEQGAEERGGKIECFPMKNPQRGEIEFEEEEVLVPQIILGI